MRTPIIKYLLSIALLPSLVECGEPKGNIDFRLVDEDTKWALYLSTEEPAKEEFELPVVSLWAKDKETGDKYKVLTSNPNSREAHQPDSVSVIVPLDCIRSINMARILSLPADPLKVLIEGCSDFRNVETYIYEDTQSTAILLPTNGRCLGLSDEEGLIIVQSYMYYEQGCRYNVISAFDLQGRQLSSMSPMLYPELNNVAEW